MDVTYSRGSHYKISDASPNAAAAPITTSTENAYVVLFQTAVDDAAYTAGEPTNYTILQTLSSTFDAVHIVAGRQLTSSGTETPGVWTHADFGATVDTYMFTIALKAGSTNETVYPFTGPWR